MIFQAVLVRQILAGHKTQTRRPLKGVDAELADLILDDEHGIREPKCRYTESRSYALQRPKRRDEMTNEELLRVDERRGRPPKLTVGRLLINAVRLERVGDISFADARREGFRTTADFKSYWLRLYEPRWFLEPGHVATERERTPEEITDRFDARHGHKPVWVITFELEPPRPRYLAARSELGYVESGHDHRGREIALMDEPADDVAGMERLNDRSEPVEAVDETSLARYAKDARARDIELAEQRRSDREALPLEERLSRLRITSWTKGIDISGDLGRITRATDTDAQLRCLRAAESKVWPMPTAAAA